MKTEFELRILDVDVAALQKKLKSLGAKKIADRSMKRYIYHFAGRKANQWLRLRDDGIHTTLTIKDIQDNSISGTKETEIIVDDINNTAEILKTLGHVHDHYQENKRISYKLGDVEIEIDFWPRLKPYVEIEGKNEKDVKDTVKKLGFSMKDTTTLNNYDIYLNAGIDIHKIKELRF